MKIIRHRVLIKHSTGLFFLMAVLLFLCVQTRPLSAQTCELIGSDAGHHLVIIDGDTCVAMPYEVAKQVLKDAEELEATEQKLKRTEDLLKSAENLNKSYDNHFKLQNALVEQTRELYKGYKELAQGYKRVKGEAPIRLSGGVGAIKDDDDYIPVVLVGASVWRLNAWAFLNKKDSGFIFGANAPLRLPFPF